MILLACLLAANAANGTNFDYSGMPEIDSAQIATVSADVRFQLISHIAKVTELILFKNTSQTPIDLDLLIPRFRQSPGIVAPPTFQIAATWGKTSLVLTAGSVEQVLPTDVNAAPLGSKVHFGPGATVPLRIAYSTPFGTTGYGGNQSVVGFQLPGHRAGMQDSIPQLNFSFAYTQRTVLGLPTLSPAWAWAVGRMGAAVRLANYSPSLQTVTATFYAGDFQTIH